MNIGGISSYLLMLGSGLVEKHYTIGVVSSGGVLAEDLRARHFRIHEFPIKTKNELHPKLYYTLPKIIALVKEEKYELLHAHTRVTQVLAHFISMATQVPVVTTAHGFFKPRFGRRIFGAWGKRVIAISPLVAEDLKKSHAVDESRIRVVQNAVDVASLQAGLAEKDRLQIRKAHGIEPDAIVLGSISRLVEDKGHGYLIQAIQRLKQKFPAIFLMILGEGREKDNLEKLAASLGIEDKVKILPASKDTTEVLSMMDIFVHPATHREGFGLTIAEAMIARKPVVATNIWAVNSIIQDGVNGYLAQPKDVNPLVKKIAHVIQNPMEVQAAVERAYRMAERLCSLERMVQETEAVYEEAMNDR